MFKHKKPVGHWIAAVWIIFSIVYGAFEVSALVRDMRNVQQAYQLGAAAAKDQTITQIIALGQECQPVQLFSGQDEERVVVTFANMDCEDVVMPEAAEEVEDEAPATEE